MRFEKESGAPGKARRNKADSCTHPKYEKRKGEASAKHGNGGAAENVLRTNWRRMVNFGYSPIGVHPPGTKIGGKERGKSPVIFGWQEFCARVSTPFEIEVTLKLQPNAEIGLCGGYDGFAPLDVDTENAALKALIAEKLAEIAPGAPVRLGNRNRLGVYCFSWRDDGNVPWLKFVDENDKVIFELLGRGRQIVAPPSMHKSGVPYEMASGGELPPLLDLPEIGMAEVDALVKAICDAGFVCNRVGTGNSDRPDEAELRAYCGLFDDQKAVEAVADYLRTKAPPSIEGSRGHDNAIRVWHACVDLGCPPERVVMLMWGFWNSRCSPPWDSLEALESELAGLINSRRGKIGSKNRERVSRQYFEAGVVSEFERIEAAILAADRKDAARILAEELAGGFEHALSAMEKAQLRELAHKRSGVGKREIDRGINEARARKRRRESNSSDGEADSEKAEDAQRVRSLSDVLNDPSATLNEALRAMNTLYAFALEGGKATVLRENIHPVTRHVFYERMTTADFKQAYQNRKFVRWNESGVAEPVKLGDAWLNWRHRRQFLGGVVFDPSGAHRADMLNLWRGFAVEPAKGSWRKTLRHIWRILCRKDKAGFKYFVRWMAFAVQHPETRGHVALIMRGDEGVGKGIVANALRKLFGQHGLHIGDAGHLVGRFNDHLQGCVLLFGDEAFFAGDKAHVAILKKIITEDTLEIEGKFRAVVESKNYMHLIMASNDSWVVPASLEARRFAVFDVSDERRGDHAYFKAIADELDNGGLEAMLHDLLKIDQSKFNVRDFPRTEGLQNQKLQSLSVEHKWLLDVLQRGYVMRSQHHLPELGEWRDDLAKDLWFESYARFAKERGERRPLDRIAFGKFMGAAGALSAKSRKAILGETSGQPTRIIYCQDGRTHPIYRYGDSLSDARRLFEEATGLRIDWAE